MPSPCLRCCLIPLAVLAVAAAAGAQRFDPSPYVAVSRTVPPAMVPVGTTGLENPYSLVSHTAVTPVDFNPPEVVARPPSVPVQNSGPEWISSEPLGPLYGKPRLHPPYNSHFVESDEPIYYAGPSEGYRDWRLFPEGLIYRSYLAGPRESRLSTVVFQEVDGSQTLWDPVLGGRVPLLRYGTANPLRPEGWQVDIEGAALVRLNLDADRDVDASDFRFGVPVSYGSGAWQYKFGYYHLSSHLGDEYLARVPGATRINYVRDALLIGVAYNPVPNLRLYGETAYAFFTSGGAEPWEFQFGAEFVEQGSTGPRGVPFFAANVHLREEVDFGGDLTFQTGWLWRGETGHMVRTGLHYLTGKSSQYQFFSQSEQQIGVGLWYDY